MKHFYHFVAVAAISVGAASCSQDMLELELDAMSTNESSAKPHTFGEDGAIEMADDFFGRSAISRGESPEVLYILNEGRSDLALPDTLAYIVNYPDNGGFVMLANDRRINPVLAYSETGNFNLESEVVNNAFVSNIADYMNASAPEGDAPDVAVPQMTTYANVGPLLVIPIKQSGAFAKYVKEEHNNNDLPAGCVPTAVAAVMIHAKNTVTFHGETIYCAMLRQPFVPQSPAFPESGSSESPDAIRFPIYTQASAIDKIAKIIWQIGKDLGTHYYEENGSWLGSTTFEPALPYLRDLGYSSPTIANSLGYWPSYNFSEIYDLIASNHIVLMSVYQRDLKMSHACVCDGCSYSLVNDGGALMTNFYIHMAWLEENGIDGYFNGNVFKEYTNTNPGVSFITVDPLYYAAIKMESNLN